jgi:hypothetical protein
MDEMNTRACLVVGLTLAAALAGCGGSGNNGSSSGGGGLGASGGATSGSGGVGASGGASSGGGGAGGGTGASDAGNIADCGAYQPGDDLHACTATYLGGPAADQVAAVDVGADGAVIFGGTVQGNDFGAAPISLLGGGSGVVLRLAATGTKVLSVTRIGQAVTDLQVDPQGGNIAVSGDFGVAVLDAKAQTVIWKADLGGAAQRVAIGSDGTVAALAGKTIHVLDPKGAALGTISTAATSLDDIALDGASHTVVVTGYRQDDGGPCQQYKSTFLRAFDYAGTMKWKDYDWSHTDVGASSDCADTQGLALGMGRDGKLYYAGKSDGGNTVHQKDPRDLSKMAPNVGSDAYNQPYGFSGANAIGYYARFNPADGAIEKGQFVVTRKGDGKGNAAVPAAVTADEAGNVLVAGAAAFEIENHDAKKIDGTPVGPYSAYEAFALVVPPDFSKRLTWTVFTKSGPADGRAVAAARGAMVFGANQSAADLMKGTLLTVNALQAAPAGDAEAYLAVWPGP